MSEEEGGGGGEEEKIELEEQVETVESRMAKVKHKIMVMSGKGGVGKTTVAANLAFALGMQGLDVGLMDADIHGPNVPKILGIEDKKPEVREDKIYPVPVTPRLKAISIAFMLPSKDSSVIWRGPLKMNAIRQFLSGVEWGELDYMIVDLPPRDRGRAAQCCTTDEEVGRCDHCHNATGFSFARLTKGRELL